MDNKHYIQTINMPPMSSSALISFGIERALRNDFANKGNVRIA
jgi:hypothetical protein